MDIESKTKEQLIKEIEHLRKQVNELEKLKAKYKHTDKELKKHHELLEESEKKFKTIFDNAIDGILIADMESKKLLMGNKTICRKLGYSQKEIKNMEVTNIHPKKDLPYVLEQFEGQVNEGFTLAKDMPVKKRDGSVFYTDVNSAPITLSGKRYLMGIFRDITKRKNMEEELRETKKQIEFVLGHTKTGLDIIDSQFNIRYIDPEWQRVYGNYRGKKCYEYFMGRKDVCPTCTIPKAFATKELVISEEVLIKENNRPVQVTTIPFQDNTGEWLVAEVNIDITERKRMENELNRYRKYLEELVKKRTEESKTINEKLAQDISRREKTEQELRESEKRYRNLWDEAPVAYHTLDTQGIITSVNKTEAKMLGYKPNEMVDKSIFDFILPEQREEAKKRFREKLTEKHLSKAERRIYTTKNGSTIYVSIDDALEYDQSGKIIGIRTTMVNVTESKKMEEALRESELQYKTTINSMRDAIHVVDADLRIILHNNALMRWIEEMGLKVDLSRKILFDVIPFLSDRVRSEYNHVFKSGEILTTEENIKFGGKEWFTEVRKIPIWENSRVSRILTVIRDISERRKTEETIRYLAYHDTLTNLPNRTLFNNRLALELNRAQRNKQKVSIMLMDLDRFKNVNDTLGHSFGDKLLQNVGKRLSEIVRSSDTVARMGGDEFILLLPETTRIQDVTKIARKILEAIKEPFLIGGKELKITTSIGISVYPTHGEDAETLIKNADIAMYQAKKSGRNKFFRCKLNFK